MPTTPAQHTAKARDAADHLASLPANHPARAEVALEGILHALLAGLTKPSAK